MAGHIERVRGRIDAVLELAEDELIAALGGREQDRLRRELEQVDLSAARVRSERAGLETICRCDPALPTRGSCASCPRRRPCSTSRAACLACSRWWVATR